MLRPRVNFMQEAASLLLPKAAKFSIYLHIAKTLHSAAVLNRNSPKLFQKGIKSKILIYSLYEAQKRSLLLRIFQFLLLN